MSIAKTTMCDIISTGGEKMDAKKIGERIAALRKERGQSKRFLAEKTGCSYTSICAYEYGLRIPCDDAKVRIANHFGVTVESIFFAE